MTIKENITESIKVKKQLLSQTKDIERLSETAKKCIENSGKLILCGNGGSFADAQHITAELVGRYKKERMSLPALCLGCNSSSSTAIGNDYSFDILFARELSALGTPKDLFLPISTSGNSPNILNAIKVAKEKNIAVFGLTGKEGGQMAQECDCIIIPSNNTPRIQECHILIGHILCELIELEA